MKKVAWILGALGLLALGCGGDDGGGSDIDAGENIDAAGPVIDAGQPDATPIEPNCTPASGTTVHLQTIVDTTAGLVEPLWVGSPPNDARLFVIEQEGRIRIVQNGSLLSTPFLAIESQTSGGNEQGLLGLAFHPQFASNGRFFINYTRNDGDTVVSEWTVSSDPNVANAASEQVLLTADQPFTNHNGGNLIFGPDGMLYIGLGDGGSGGDPQTRAQNTTNLFGSMLRIDVSTPGSYAIPSDNPFVGAGGGVREEIWAFGLRNPWRWSFDRMTGDMIIGDVGQGPTDPREEVDILPANSPGLNFGWDCREGDIAFEAGNCAGGTLFQEPISVYDHGGGRCSVTGGFVYRGTCMPDLQGTYFFADYCSAELFSYPIATPAASPTALFDTGTELTSFGEDATGEVYVVHRNGRISQIVLDTP